MLGPCGRQLVEFEGKMVSACNPDYAFRNQPFLKPVFGLILFIVLLGFVLLLFKIMKPAYIKYKEGQIKIRSLLATILLAGILLYYSIVWLIYAIKSF